MKNTSLRNPTPYPDLNKVLGQLVTSIKDILARNFIGAYLQGSFALGDFDEHSDVDYIVAIHDKLTDSQVSSLQIMHGRIFDVNDGWPQHLEGSYFPRDILKDYKRSGEKLWYLDNGHRQMQRSDHCNTVLVRWIVRESGVRLAGPPPDTLVDPIPVEVLRRDIYDTIIYWGQHILDNPDKFNNRFYQTYLVLNYCRMLNDLINGYPGSKRAGAQWAKRHFDAHWHGLIDRTWAGS
jgi:predicted nucleotidyltransferase